MPARSSAQTIDEYIGSFPPETQAVLQQVREAIRAAAPDAVETISYAIPTFDLAGKHMVHFAGYDRHIGFYPTGSGAEAFREDFSAYKTGKGSVQFPLGEPMPLDLIQRVVRHRMSQIQGR